MSYTDDGVLAKLSALNETQESIVTTAQWVMFHRRHADHTVQLWLQRLKDSGSNKRLNLMYLANEIVQQTRARRKDDFLLAFSPVIADACAIAYKGASNDVQTKLRKVVDVWKQRQIFEPSIQLAAESRINDLDKSKGVKKPLLGGSLFSSSGPSAPAELQPLIPLQTAVNKANVASKAATATANSEYDKLVDPSITGVSPPRQSAQLGGLLKTLAHAEQAVAEVIKARKALIESLTKILDGAKAEVVANESDQSKIQEQKEAIDARKQDIEAVLLREMSEGGAGNGTPLDGSPDGYSREPEAPEIEPLSPSIEALTPVGSPNARDTSAGGTLPDNSANSQFHDKASIQTPLLPVPGSDLLSSLAMPEAKIGSASPTNGFGMKKRKFNNDEDFSAIAGGDAMGGLDDDVAEMLK